MGIVIKQSSISSVLTYLGAIVGFVNTLILYPAFLSPDQIGLIRVLPNIAFMVMPLAQLGLTQAVIKFAPEFKKHNSLGTFFSLSLMIVAAGTIMVCSLLWFGQDLIIDTWFSDSSPILRHYFHVAILLVFILSIYTLLEIFSRVLLKIIALNFIKEILVRILTSLAVTLYFLDIINFAELANGLLAIYTIALISLGFYLLNLNEVKLSVSFQDISKDQIKRLANYSSYSIIGASGVFLVLNIDQVMITSMLGLDANGLYTTSFFFAVLIDMSRRAISQITTPLISDSFEKGEVSEVKKIYQQLSINQMVIGSFLFIGIAINLDNIYALMPNGDIYSVGKYIVMIIGCAKLVDMTFSNNSEIIVMSKYFKFNVVSLVILCILLVTMNWVFIPIYGINGAAIGTLIAALIFNLIKMIFLKVKYQISPFRINNLKMLFIIGAVLSIGLFLPRIEFPVLDILYRSTIVTILFGISVIAFNISPELTGLYKKYMKLVLEGIQK
ncbi:MAG: oligosaccharide flippase family protein [Reichenbachiella sp.]